MSDPTRTLRDLAALVEQMARSANEHPLLLVEVSKALFVDQVVRPIHVVRAALSTTPAPDPEWLELTLAADIRAIDGNHITGASALAEALIERGWTRRSTP